MIGRTLSHYRITAAIGAGGMGEVWLAEDTRLDRQVAIKLLPAEFTQDEGRVRRFMHEAKAASALNHPNIITVYDIGESEAGRFIVMERVFGRTLRAVMAEDPSLATLLTLGSQMARALSAAHAAGITHRDIKPDNVMVRDDGYVKVLDFGLARLRPATEGDAEAATLAQQTLPGQVMGTLAYMSPEQARGETVGHPSDIFALGIVLYELATGQHPFKATTLVGYLHAITLQTPPPPTRLKPEIPAAMNALILRMLEKEAAKRPAAGEVAQTLEEMERHGMGHIPPMQTPPSGAARADEGFWVAVLPFKWRGANAELEALAEGLTEDIVTGLSRFSHLRVIARSSTLRYASDSGDVRTVGKELGARYVMDGSLRQAGSMLRVVVQLLDASTGAHLWAETYDRPFRAEEVFALQDDLVPRIVSTVADWYGVLPHSMSEAVRLKPPDQLSPYEAVLRSFGYYERVTAEEHAAARSGLERAVQQAPGNADGWAMLSMMYGEEHRFGFNAQPDPLGRSLHAARRAADAAPSNHFAYLALAQALFFRKEFDAFRSAAERAIALNPMDGSTVEYIGHLIAFSGDWEHGCDVAERARQLNPNHPGWYWAVPFYNAYRNGDYASARTFALKIDMPTMFFWHAMLAALYGQLGEREAAGIALRELLVLKPDFALIGRNELGKWYLPELVDHLMDGLRKAGLLIAGEEGVSTPSPATGTRATGRSFSSSPPISQSPHRHTVGRERERNELRAALNAARAGRGSLLCVAGEPGIGKTTLVEDFLAEMTAQGQSTIARGRSSERLAGTEAYLPLLEALESLLPGDGNPAMAQAMKQMAPTWYAQVVPLSGYSEESARFAAEVKAASHERMKRELATFLQEVAQQHPLVLFFDDLHWADVSTIDLLSFLAGKFDALNVLTVVTYRPSDMLLGKHPFWQIKPDLQARGVCRELLLEFLNEAEIAQYLALEFPGHRFPAEFPKLIHAKTEGSPLFMADLVRYLRDRGVIANTSGTWTLAQALPDVELELPESVRGMIERKIAQLSEEDRKLLAAASVQGYEFDSAVVAQALHLEADEVEERLEKLERVFAFVKLTSETEFPNRTLTLRYQFVHVLYQNALYTSLRATRKAKLSREVAQTLENCYGAKKASVASELAALHEAGREFAKAADYFRLAAEHASQVFAEREAAALARRGIEALQSLPETPERAQQELTLQVLLGLSLRTIKGFASAETGGAYARARALCQQIGDSPQLFPILFGLWENYQNHAQLETAMELGAQLLHAAGEDPALLLVAHNVMGDNLLWLGDFIAAREHLEKGIALYDFEQHRSNASLYGYDSGMACLTLGSIVLWHLGYPDQALKMSDEALRLARKLSHPVSLAYATGLAAWLHQLNGSMEMAQELAETTIATSAKYDIALLLAWGKMMRSWALIGQREIEQGIALAVEGIGEWRATGALLGLSWLHGILAEGHGAAGRSEEALTLLTEAMDLASKQGEHFCEAELYRLRGNLLLKRNGARSALEAESCFHQAIDIARRQSAKSFELRAGTSLARLWQQQGKREEAQQMLAEIYGGFTEGFDTADLKEAKALLGELQHQAEASPSIAVLPFVNISNDPDNEYFCEGLAEELLNALSKIEALRVAARTSSFSFKGKEGDIREIGQKLNVRAVLEGSVRKAGNRLRITAQLVNVTDGYRLWSEKYDRQMEDIFDIQDEISLAIVHALKVKLLGAEKAVVVKRYTDNAEVYQLYLKGRFFVNRRTSESLQKAIEYFNQAIALDANYALGYAGLADAYLVLGVPDAITGALAPEDSLPQARAAAEKALQIDNSVGEIYAALAHVKWKERDWAGAEGDYDRSIKLNPNYPIAHFYHAVYLASLGRQDEAVKEIRRAQELDPLSLPINASVTYVLYLGRQYDAAIEAGKKTLEMDAAFALTHQRLGLAYVQKQMYREAIAEFEQAAHNSNRAPLSIVSLGHAYAVAGNKAEAQKVLAELKDLSQGRYVSPYGVAMIYVGLGDKEQAFQWLERATNERNTELTFLKVDPRLDPLRDDPRFQELLKKVGFPQ